MAIYRLNAQIHGRQKKDRKTGKPIKGTRVSIVSKAAYRSGERLKDHQADKTFNYRSRTQEVVHAEIMAPEQAPEWMADREALWNAIERVEKRKDSQLAREFVVALPVELDEQQQIDLVRGWCDQEFVEQGFVVDFAVHRSKEGKKPNPHAHILVTTRPVDETRPEGFGLKPSTDGKFKGRGKVGVTAKDELVDWRESWADAENAALEDAGSDARVDHRSYVDREIDRIPQPKIGPEATAMNERGEDTKRHEEARWVEMQNEVMPFERAIEQHGEIAQVGVPGSTFGERMHFMWEQLQARALEFWHDESSGALRREEAVTSWPAAPKPSGEGWQQREGARREMVPDMEPELG